MGKLGSLLVAPIAAHFSHDSRSIELGFDKIQELEQFDRDVMAGRPTRTWEHQLLAPALAPNRGPAPRDLTAKPGEKMQKRLYAFRDGACGRVPLAFSIGRGARGIVRIFPNSRHRSFSRHAR